MSIKPRFDENRGYFKLSKLDVFNKLNLPKKHNRIISLHLLGTKKP